MKAKLEEEQAAYENTIIQLT